MSNNSTLNKISRPWNDYRLKVERDGLPVRFVDVIDDDLACVIMKCVNAYWTQPGSELGGTDEEIG